MIIFKRFNESYSIGMDLSLEDLVDSGFWIVRITNDDILRSTFIFALLKIMLKKVIYIKDFNLMERILDEIEVRKIIVVL